MTVVNYALNQYNKSSFEYCFLTEDVFVTITVATNIQMNNSTTKQQTSTPLPPQQTVGE